MNTFAFSLNEKKKLFNVFFKLDTDLYGSILIESCVILRVIYPKNFC